MDILKVHAPKGKKVESTWIAKEPKLGVQEQSSI